MTGSSDERETLRLEGHLGGPTVGELHRISQSVLASGRTLRLDLAGVSFVDRDGIELLRTLKQLKAELIHCSAFVALELGEQSAG